MSGSDANTEAHVRSLLVEMSKAVDAIILESSISERFTAQYSLKSLASRLLFNSKASAVAHMYAGQRVRVMRQRLTAKYSLEPQDLKIAVSEFILWALVQAHTQPLPKVLPKLHHWLPICYTKQFASRVMTSRRAAIIQQITFNSAGEVEAMEGVRDTFFAHEKSEEGYYPAHLEQFFCRIESAFSGTCPETPTQKNAWMDVAHMAFFVVQAARNPDPRAKDHFSSSHKGDIVPAIFALIESYDTPYIQYARDCTNLRFSPFFPPRVRRTATGITAGVFPLNPKMAMVVTDREISEGEANQIAQGNAEAMIRHAARTGQPLYGVE